MNLILKKKKYIILSIIITIASCSITYATTKFYANEIIFNPTNSNKEQGYTATNVEDALNELFEGNINGNILYSTHNGSSTEIIENNYEFDKAQKAILVVTMTHGNNNNSYYHYLYSPTIQNGSMIKVIENGIVDQKTAVNDIKSEYIYLINAKIGTKVTVREIGNGWTNFNMYIIG